MATQNSMGLKGHITIKKTEVKTGETTVVYDGPNLIVDNGIRNVIHGLAAGETGYPVTQIQVGSGSISPTAGDVDLQTPVQAFEIIDAGSETITEPDLINYNVFISDAQANGYTLTEVGLLLEGGGLFARQIIPAVVKTSAITLTIDWRISCAVD